MIMMYLHNNIKRFVTNKAFFVRVSSHAIMWQAQEEIKSRLKSGNACYNSVQNPLSSSLLSENLKIKIYTTIICLLFCMGVKLGR